MTCEQFNQLLCLVAQRSLDVTWRRFRLQNASASQQEEQTLFSGHGINREQCRNIAHNLGTRGEEHVPTRFGWQKVAYQFQVIGIVQNEEPTTMVFQPALHRLDDTIYFSFLLLRQLQESGQREITGLQAGFV